MGNCTARRKGTGPSSSVDRLKLQPLYTETGAGGRDTLVSFLTAPSRWWRHRLVIPGLERRETWGTQQGMGASNSATAGLGRVPERDDAAPLKLSPPTLPQKTRKDGAPLWLAERRLDGPAPSSNECQGGTSHRGDGVDVFWRLERICCRRLFSMATPARAAWAIFCAISVKLTAMI